MTRLEELGKEMDRPARVLFVDDEDTYLQTMATWLRKVIGCEVVEASSGEDALEKLEMLGDGWPDLVIADYVMPGLSGLSLLRAVRMRDDQIPFLIVTGYSDRLSEIALVANSVTVVAPKTIDLNILESHIRRLLRRW